jgi:hypothetical protein
MLSKTRATLALALTVPLLLLASCGNEEAQDAQVRLVNATSEYPTMDLYTVDSKNVSTKFISGTPSFSASGYEGLFGGTYTFKVLGSGSSTAAAQASGSVTKQDHFAIVSYLSGGAATALLVPEEEPAPSSGNAKLRILNAASAEVGGVDVYVTSNPCTALTSTDTAFATAVTGLQTTFGEIIVASSGTAWNVCVVGTGNKQDLRMAANGVQFANQQISTLILTHTAGGTLLNGMVMNQQGTITPFTNSLARVRVVADAALGATVSATINDIALATEQNSPTILDYAAIPSGALTMALTIGGTAVTTTPLTASAGTDYTLLVAGTAGAATVAFLTDDNTPSTSTTLPVKMRLVNGLNGSTGTASLTAGGSSVAAGVPFGIGSAYKTLAAADGTAEIIVSDAGLTLLDLTSQTLQSGGVYTVFLIGDLSSTPPAAGSNMILDNVPVPVAPPASGASS